MRFLMLGLIVFSLSALAGGGESKLRLSDSADLSWAATVEAKPLFSSTPHTFFLSGRYQKKLIDGQIHWAKPAVLANPISVESLWRENLRALAKLEAVGKDHGCKRLSSAVFRCERSGRSGSGAYVHDAIIFNGSKDLVHVRVNSRVSPEHAAAANGELKVVVQ